MKNKTVEEISIDTVDRYNEFYKYYTLEDFDRLLKENKKLKQWDKNKDTRNSRQRIANAKLTKENKQLKEVNTLYKLGSDAMNGLVGKYACEIENLKEIISIKEITIQKLKKELTYANIVHQQFQINKSELRALQSSIKDIINWCDDKIEYAEREISIMKSKNLIHDIYDHQRIIKNMKQIKQKLEEIIKEGE